MEKLKWWRNIINQQIYLLEKLHHSTTPSFVHSSFPPLHHSTTPSFQHSITPSFHHSITPSFHHSTTPSFQHSIIPTFHHSTTPSFQHSIIPSLHHSIIPPLHHSIVPYSPANPPVNISLISPIHTSSGTQRILRFSTLQPELLTS